VSPIEVHGERFKAVAWYDDRDRDPKAHGWFIEYRNAEGDCVDDSEKIWHPRLLESPDDADGVTAIATAYLAKLEGGAS
jgi:hypothetical protein